MYVTNKSKKIINIGTLTLVPGDTEPLPPEFEQNPVVAFLAGRGYLETSQTFQAGSAPLTDGGGTPSGGTGVTDHATELAARIEAIEKMKRAELDAACAEAGIEVAESDTVPTLREKLIAKLRGE